MRIKPKVLEDPFSYSLSKQKRWRWSLLLTVLALAFVAASPAGAAEPSEDDCKPGSVSVDVGGGVVVCVEIEPTDWDTVHGGGDPYMPEPMRRVAVRSVSTDQAPHQSGTPPMSRVEQCYADIYADLPNPEMVSAERLRYLKEYCRGAVQMDQATHRSSCSRYDANGTCVSRGHGELVAGPHRNGSSPNDWRNHYNIDISTDTMACHPSNHLCTFDNGDGTTGNAPNINYTGYGANGNDMHPDYGEPCFAPEWINGQLRDGHGNPVDWNNLTPEQERLNRASVDRFGNCPS